jgi:two-component system, OmpR family, response regulator
MLPLRLALIDDDAEYGQYLAAYLRSQGIDVQLYADSNLLLADPGAFGHEFYIVDLMLPGLDGVELIKRLRLRSRAGVLVVSGRLAPDVFANVVHAGADMYLAKPVQFEQVLLAVQAVHRRSLQLPEVPWRLEREARELVAPDGARVGLSDADLLLLDCFLHAGGAVVPREALLQRLGRLPEDGAHDPLNATIFRLRRRIERATPLPMPVQSRSRQGYCFSAPLLER